MTETEEPTGRLSAAERERMEDLALTREWADQFQQTCEVKILKTYPELATACLVVAIQHYLRLNVLVEGKKVLRKELSARIVQVVEQMPGLTFPEDASEYLNAVATWIVKDVTRVKIQWNRFGYGRVCFLKL